MMRATITGAALVIALVVLVLALVVRYPALDQDAEPAAATSAAMIPSTQAVAPATHNHSSFIYGHVTVDGAAYEGRLRWGGDQEASWGDYFNGAKSGNPWAAHAPLEPGEEHGRIEIFGFEIGGPDHSNLERLFMARFGDIARIEARVAKRAGDTQERHPLRARPLLCRRHR